MEAGDTAESARTGAGAPTKPDWIPAALRHPDAHDGAADHWAPTRSDSEWRAAGPAFLQQHDLAFRQQLMPQSDGPDGRKENA